MSDSGKAVFLSYASQDAEAAKRICEALRAAGVEVWFDQSELVGGDQWDGKIRGQISSCALFVPIISANTQARLEGYFRIEWKLAARRTHAMATAKAFLLPIVIDDTHDTAAHVPDEFREVQWSKLPGGETPLAFCARVKKLLDGTVGASLDGARGRAQGAPLQDAAGASRSGPSKWWWALPIFGVTMAMVLVLKEQRREAPAVHETVSPARQLTERARAILDQGSLTRAQLDAAGELCDKALQLDSTDALVWARAASVDLELIYPYGYDRSEERRRRARERAARATSLAPDQFEVKLVQARVFAHAVGTPALLTEAEKMFREMRALHPEDRKVVVEYAEVMREQKRFEEAAGLFKGIGEFQVAAWSYHQGGKLRAALAALEHSPRSVTGLQLKAILQVSADEDLAAAQATVDQLHPSELLAEMPAAIALNIAMYRRDPARVLEITQGLTQDYLDSNAFRGPRQFYTGLAHELAGRNAAAEGEWRAGLAVIQARLKTAPDDRGLLLWSAWLHAALKDPAEAERLLARAQALAGLSGDTMDDDNAKVLLRLRHKDALLAGIDAIFQSRRPNWETSHAEMRFSPEVDWLRGDLRFEKFLRDNLPPGAKPFDNAQGRPFDDQKTTDQGPQTVAVSGSPASRLQSPSHPPLADAKSVAVLAFANLSDDKGNEYFSDGISEELLNVLAKVPGLKVSARTSAFYFKGKEVPIPEIAKQLGVAYVVEGSVRKQGDKVRITAQLIKAADGFHVWSDTFTRDLKDIFAVQDEIAGLIAKNLELKMGIGETGARQAVSPEAYQAFLVGRAAVTKASMTDMREAVGHFERAVAREPKYTAAWVQLASAHTRLGRWGGAPTLSSWASARAAIDRALALEPDSPEVLLALGWVLRTAEWDWRGAERAFRRALALQPNNPEILAGTAVLLFNIGQIDEAFRLARQAVQLDPLNPGTQVDLSIMFFESRNWVESERAARRALQLAPDGTSYHSVLAWPLINQGRYVEAEAEIALDTDLVQQSGTMGLLAIARGDLPKVREMLARLEELARTQPDRADLQTCTAWLHAGLGDKDRAFTALEKARASRDPSMAWLRDNTELTPLFSDPRWDALLHQVGLADEQLK